MIFHRRCFSFSIWLLILTTSETLAQLTAPFTVKGMRGSGAALTCTYPVPMLATPTISWEKKGDGDSVTVATSVSGISHINDPLTGRASLVGANLTISSLKILDSGTYTCKVIGAGIASLSASTNLVVTAVPSLSTSAIKSPTIQSNGKYAAATCIAHAGKPKASIQWTNKDGKIQDSLESETLAEDGSWDAESMLLLTPGLLGRLSNSTLPISFEEKVQEFFCRVSHEDLVTAEQRTRKVMVDVLYPPHLSISLVSNLLTCHVEGNPTPALKWFLPNGDVISGESAIHIGPTASENGRYTCLASSGLPPDAISTLDVQKAQDLPSLFRTLVRLETSLPTTASGYEIECLAEVTGSVEATQGLSFQWTRNERVLDDDSYQVRTRINTSNPTKPTISSTLRFVDVLRGRDDATFRCRLVNTSLATGFVTAVERSVRVSVDYAPSNALIVGVPNDFTVLKGRELSLECAAESQPSSTYEWYFNGKPSAVGSLLTLEMISRDQAGTYRCLAYNYVPGSARDDVTVTVQYPPSDVVIVELPNYSLSCVARGGSVPPPIYTWLYPNHTYSKGNLSTIRLLSDSVSSPSVYVCIVSNNLGYSANATFVQLPPAAAKIGALSITEFSVTMVICAIIIIIIIISVGWFLHRRRQEMADSKKMSAEETFKRYLQYTEPPESAAPIERRGASVTNGEATDVMRAPDDNIMSRKENTSIKEANRTDGNPTNTDDRKGNFVRLASPTSCTRSPHKQNRNYSDVDGSSIEIVANDSLTSFQGKRAQIDADLRIDERKTCKSPGKRSPPRHAEPRPFCDASRGSTLPCPARLAHIRRDVARHMQAQTLIPMQYFPQGTVPRLAQANVPMRIHHQHPVGLVIPGYDPVLYDDTWRPGLPDYHRMESELGQYPAGSAGSRRPTPINEASTLSEATSASTEGSEDYLHGSRNSGPHSMSLSASYSSSGSFTPSYHTSEVNAQKGKESQNLGGDQIPLKNISGSRTVSPFDSGHDSTKSIQTTTKPNKQQSMTLV